MTIPEPKRIEIDNRGADHAEKLEHARDVLRRWQEHKNQNPQKPHRELVPISSDEGCHGEPKPYVMTTSPEEVEFSLLGRQLTDEEIAHELRDLEEKTRYHLPPVRSHHHRRSHYHLPPVR